MGRIDDLRKKLGLPPGDASKRCVFQTPDSSHTIKPVTTTVSKKTSTVNLHETPTLEDEMLMPSPLFRLLTGIGFYSMDPIKFEELIMGIFELFGFQGKLTPPSGDHGIDIELRSRSGNLLVVQCKRYQHDQLVSPKEVREFLGAITFTRATEGYFVTTSRFSEQCRVFAQGQPLHLVDGDALGKLMLLAETAYRYTSRNQSCIDAPEDFVRSHL